jgi:hypothetical protein
MHGPSKYVNIPEIQYTYIGNGELLGIDIKTRMA